MYCYFHNAVAVDRVYTYFKSKTKMSAAKRNFNELNFSEMRNNWASEKYCNMEWGIVVLHLLFQFKISNLLRRFADILADT